MEESKRKHFLGGPRTAPLIIAVILLVFGMGWFVLRVGAKNLVGSGQAHAEKTAVSTLRTLHWAQGIFRSAAWIDEDGNGVGEFGTLGQLAAEAPLPSGKTIPAPLTPTSRTRLEGEVFEAAGHCFRLDLPEGAHQRERRFVAWAWPVAPGAGTRLFCLDQNEQIFEGPAGETLGCDAGPPEAPCPPDQTFVRWRGKTNVRPVGAR